MRKYVSAKNLVRSKRNKYDEDLAEFETMNFPVSIHLFPERPNNYDSQEIEKEVIKEYKRSLLFIR